MGYVGSKSKTAKGKISRGVWIAVLLAVIGVIDICLRLSSSSSSSREEKSDQNPQSVSKEDVQEVLKSYVEYEISELAQGRITPEFVEAAARIAQGVKGYDLEPDLVRMCQGNLKPDSVREFLNMAMTYLVKIPADDGRLVHFVTFSDYVLCGDSIYSEIQDETNECLAEIHKQSEIIVAGTEAIAKRMAKADCSQDKASYDKLEPCRAAMSKLAKTLFDFTHTAQMIIDYNPKARFKSGDELKMLRQKYLDSGIDEKAFPVDVKNRTEQRAFIKTAWEKMFVERNSIWNEMGRLYKAHPKWEEELWYNAMKLDFDMEDQYRTNRPRKW